MSHAHQPSFASATPVVSVPTYPARALTKGGAQARIELDGKLYDLRITRAGKLILTK